MLSELGHLLIFISIISSLCLIFYSVKEKKNKKSDISSVIKNSSLIQLVSTCLSFFILMSAYILSDFSLVESYKFQSKNMGVGTVGLPHDGSLWIGSYHSDRIAEGSLSSSE